MADLKISQLTSASTPLAGTEVLPIVQSGSTVKVSVANLTAGRAVGMAGGSFTDNITQSTAAKGVNFTANTPAAGMTSQLLNWYEEGTFTPTFVPSGTGFTSITYATATGAQYVRVGRIVHVQIWVETTATTIGSASGVLRVGGLPFTTAASTGSTSNGFGALSVSYADGFPGATPQNAMPRANSTQIDFYYQTSTTTGPASQITAADMGTGSVALVLAGTYICA